MKVNIWQCSSIRDRHHELCCSCTQGSHQFMRHSPFCRMSCESWCLSPLVSWWSFVDFIQFCGTFALYFCSSSLLLLALHWHLGLFKRHDWVCNQANSFRCPQYAFIQLEVKINGNQSCLTHMCLQLASKLSLLLVLVSPQRNWIVVILSRFRFLMYSMIEF